MHGNSLAGDPSPGPGDGAQHDGEGTGRQGGEEAEVQRTLHAVVAHAHHGVQVVLKASDAKHSTMSDGRSSKLLPRADERSIIHEGERSPEWKLIIQHISGYTAEKSRPLLAFSPPSVQRLSW